MNHPVAAWSRGLASQKPSERIAAVQGVERFGRDDTDAALTALIRGLDDPDADVTAASAMALVTVISSSPDQLRSEHIQRATEALIGRLNDPAAQGTSGGSRGDWHRRNLLAQAPATEMSLDKAAAVLLACLGDQDPAVRLGAVHSLATLGPKVYENPPPALFSAMEDDSEKIRQAVARAIAEYRGGLSRALPALIAAIDKGSPRFRTALVDLLTQIDVSRIGVSIVPALVAALATEDLRVVTAAVTKLSGFAFGVNPDPRLTNWSSAEFSRMKNAADCALPALAATLDRLANALQQSPMLPNPRLMQTSTAIAECLERLAPGTASQDEAREALRGSSNPPSILKFALPPRRRLGRFRASPELFTALTSLIEDCDPAVRVAGMWSIDHVDFHDGYFVPEALVRAIEDSSAQVRAAAAAAMGHAGLGLDTCIPRSCTTPTATKTARYVRRAVRFSRSAALPQRSPRPAFRRS